MFQPRQRLAVVAVVCLAALCGCATVTEIRVENVSTFDFTDVSVAGVPYGDIAVGAISDYKPVKLKFKYALIRLEADGRAVNAQTLNFGSKRFTHRIAVKDLQARHLAVEVVRE